MCSPQLWSTPSPCASRNAKDEEHLRAITAPAILVRTLEPHMLHSLICFSLHNRDPSKIYASIGSQIFPNKPFTVLIMSLSLLLWFLTAHLKDFLDSLSGSGEVYTVGHSYLQCKRTHTQPLTVSKLLINERVDSGSGLRLLLSRLSDVFLLEMFTTCVRLAFQRVHSD